MAISSFFELEPHVDFHAQLDQVIAPVSTRSADTYPPYRIIGVDRVLECYCDCKRRERMTTTMACSMSPLNRPIRSVGTMNVLAVYSSAFSVVLAPGRGSNVSAVRHRRRMVVCSSGVTLTSTSADEEISKEANAKVGCRVRVKVPLKVFHVPRVPEVDLTGMEGTLKQYVGLWKGKRISANFPYKVEFLTQIEGRGPVKFFAHLKEDEFEYVDDAT